QEALRRRKYQNWAIEGKATQSSTYENNLARLAIDGKLNTYSQTLIGRSWWQVELSMPIAIKQVKIMNRLGTFQIKSRISPFKIMIINDNGANVGEKQFDEVRDTYTWENIDLVGRIARVELLSNNYLHMAEVEVWGEPAESCETYLNKY